MNLKIENLYKDTYFVGDTHGDWHNLLKVINHYELKECNLIHVGDIGIGFASQTVDQQNNILWLLADLLADLKITFIGIRGNHDNPHWFETHYSTGAFNNVHLVPDYSTLEINGERFLFVGGGVSIDRTERLENCDYWRGELFKLDESAQECDVLVSHIQPSWIGPFGKKGISYWTDRDPTLEQDIIHERKLYDRLVEIVKPKFIYSGHMHVSEFVENNGVKARILNINEIFLHEPYKSLV